MLKVKISIGWNMPFQSKEKNKELSIFNFTNTKDNTYNGKKFYINSEVKEPDFWFIIENTDSRQKETVNIDKKNIIFLGSETRYQPSYFLLKSKKEFLSQFSTIYSPNYLNLRNSVNEPAFLNWKLRGDPFENKYNDSDIEFYKNFKPEKSKLLSVYCTGKQINEIHKVRFDFVKKLKSIFGDDLHWYGFENKTKDKIEGIGSYKYHLVLENQLGHNLMSEKLYDSYLGNSYPIYAGATNAEDYFPNKSLSKINLNDFNSSIETIKDCISNNYYEKNYDELIEARKVVLERFNLIKRIDRIVEQSLRVESKNNYKSEITIYPKFYFEGNNRLSRTLFSINKRLKKLSTYFEKFYS